MLARILLTQGTDGLYHHNLYESEINDGIKQKGFPAPSGSLPQHKAK